MHYMPGYEGFCPGMKVADLVLAVAMYVKVLAP